MGEYAVVTAAVAVILVSALGGLKALPATGQQATSVVAAAAKRSGTDTAVGRRALARAPYKRHQLRTLFALGWLAGLEERPACLIATSTGGSTVEHTRAALRQVPNWRALLRRSKVTEAAAVAAADRGLRASCGG